MKQDFKKGIIASIPIVLGYFFVSIGVGAYAFKNNFTPFQAALMSFTNLTSAGEISAIGIFGENGGYLELLLAQIVINARYALMGISLSQKDFASGFKTKSRIMTSYGITDEIFAVLIDKKEPITLAFALPLMLLPIFSWTTGTLLGALFSSFLPKKFESALGFLIYAMLISIIAPESKKRKPILLAVCIAALLSCALHYFALHITSGYGVIISSLLAAAICALIFPMDVPKKEGGV